MITGLLIGFMIGAISTFIYMNQVIVPNVIKKLEKEGLIKLLKGGGNNGKR